MNEIKPQDLLEKCFVCNSDRIFVSSEDFKNIFAGVQTDKHTNRSYIELNTLSGETVQARILDVREMKEMANSFYTNTYPDTDKK